MFDCVKNSLVNDNNYSREGTRQNKIIWPWKRTLYFDASLTFRVCYLLEA